jgi:EAL domain-containing protein (putative c-di-GMP-specific phosphodiesterase class I)
VNLSEEATDDGVIVRSTIDLGHNMGLKVVAEGVEGFAVPHRSPPEEVTGIV